MATKRLNYPIEPMDLANMRENGVRSLAVMCHQCRHDTVMNVDHLPGDLTVPLFGPRMVCSKCRAVGADVRPNWQERPVAAARASTIRRWSAVRLTSAGIAKHLSARGGAQRNPPP